jgi:1,4-dihydroxy-2-naphthoate octaprenyltransferase
VRSLDAVSRFLYAARSVILVISAQAAIIAGLLAAAAGRFAWGSFLGVLIGFLVAHMISNLSNDYVGFRRGHDTPDSPRMRYTVHPLASGVLEKRTLLSGLAILVLIGVAITI